MKRVLVRSLAVVGAAALLGIWATPASAGSPIALTVGGSATCNLATGHETYQLNWTVTAGNAPTAPNQPLASGIDIAGAVESGAWAGNVTFTPNPVPWGTTASGSDGPVPNTAGTVTLTVSYSYSDSPTYTATGAIVLDGLCKAQPATPPPAPAAVAQAQPRFTG